MLFRNLICLLVATWCLPLQAYQVDGIDIHGSLSQSYLHSHGHEWLIPGSSDGTFKYTEFALNAHKQFDRWNIGAQVLSRDFGREGDFELRLDWGHVEYNPMDPLSLRLGRVKLPIGMYAEYRDVDVARTEILLPQSFIPEDYRAAAVAYDGIGMIGDIFLDENHLFQYHLFWGTNDIQDDFFLNYDTQSIYRTITGAVPGAPVPSLSQEQANLDSKTLHGGQLIWTYEPWQWRLGYNYIHYIGHFGLRFYDLKNFGGVGLPSVVTDEKGLELDIQWHVLSTDITIGDWFLRAETLLRINDYTQGPLYMDRYGSFFLTQNLVDGNELWSWYASAQRQLTDTTSVYASFGRYIITEEIPATARPKKLNEFSAAIRHDFTENVLGKLQVFHYWDYRTTLDESTNNDSSWGMILARLTVHF